MQMKNKTLKLFIVLLTTLPQLANAGMISLGNGNVTSDTDSDIIVDHLNQREYLRFDVLGAMTYQEQVELTTTGAYAEFSIADHLISFDFINSLLDGQTGNCQEASIILGFCNMWGPGTLWSEGDLGLSYQSDYDYWLFENTDNSANNEFGLAGIRNFGTVYSYSNWGSEASVNFFGKHQLLWQTIS